MVFARDFVNSLNGPLLGIRPIKHVIEYSHREWICSLLHLKNLKMQIETMFDE